MNPKAMGGMQEDASGGDQMDQDLEARVADLEQRVSALEAEDKQENEAKPMAKKPAAAMPKKAPFFGA